MQSLDISIRSNIKEIQKKLSATADKQVPFATATALTALAKKVQEAEKQNMRAVLDRPTPFTVNSVKVKAARKNDLVAMVYVMDTAAEYLEPFEVGGAHKITGKAILNPKDISLNQYGNLPKAALSRLKGRSDIFIGPVKTKNGIVSGVWQRPFIRANQKIRGKSKVTRGSNTTGKLKLLIRFGDALPVKQRLGYRDLARTIVNANMNKVFGKALAKAMA